MGNKTIIVTGAAGNLGSAVCRHFKASGWNVAGLVHHKNEESSEDAHYQEFEVNLLDGKATEEIIVSVTEDFGSVGVAVLTAGGYARGNIINTDVEDIRKLFQLNFETAYNVVRPLLEKMKEQKEGKIFLTGSETGMDTRSGKGSVAYSLSKSLLFQLANMINADAGKLGVSAYVIVPGTIDTPQNREAMPKADFSTWQTPDRIAGIIKKYAVDEKAEDPLIIIGKEK